MSSQPRFFLSAARLLVILLILAGCAPVPAQPPPVAPTSPPAPTAAAAQPTAAAPTAAAPTETVATAAPSSTAQPEPAATTAAESSAPAPIFGPAWGDRSVYEAGLITSERGVLDQLPGASEYRIELEIAPTMTNIAGHQQVFYTNREDKALDEIYMRLFPNALGGKMVAHDVSVNGAAVTPEYKFSRTALRVPLAQPLQSGESVVIELWYEIEAPDTLDKGYGLISYTNGILALDTPYAPIPVYNQEGWNVETPPENADTSFNDVSFYLVQITAPHRVKLVATGVEVKTVALSNDQGEVTETAYALGPARDFFVAASENYVVQTRQVGETRINSYALPGQESGAETTLAAAAKGIELYGKRFGPYPYTEFDIAATPMLALGIEYPGTVGISERIYEADYKPGSGSAAIQQESTTAHELAHQWFYNLVGNDQVDQPWLDEAMAQYSTCLYFGDVYGQAGADACKAGWGSRWDRTDRAEKPVGLPAADYTQREYSSIVYGRGPMFVDALAERMGRARFDQFLKDYTARFRWGIATTNDFKTMAGQACGCDLNDLYKQWLDPQ